MPPLPVLSRRLLPGIVAALLILAGALLHPCEVPSGEYDRYPDLAEKLMAGGVSFDRFHPFAYPLLIVPVAWLTGDAFAAGRIVSALAAGLLLWSTIGLGRALLPAGIGRIALAALLLLNGHFLVHGVLAASDMTATAFTATALLHLVRHRAVPAPRRALLAGLFAGLAVATRFSCSFLVPVLLLGVPGPRGRRLRPLLWCALGLAVGYLPQGILGTVATGSPFRNDNWQNTVLKVVCDYDYARYQEMYESGTIPAPAVFLREHGGEILRQGVHDLGETTTTHLADLVFGGTPGAAVGIATVLLLLLGLGLLARTRRAVLLLLAYAVLHVVSVCFTFSPSPRVLLPVLPVLLLGAAALIAALRPQPLAAALALGAVAWTGWNATAVVGAFLRDHPSREIQLARELPGRLQRPVIMVATYGLMNRYVPFVTWGIAFFGRSAEPTREQILERVLQRMRQLGADVFLTGRVTNHHAFHALRTGDLPDGLRRIHVDDEVVALALAADVSDWFTGVEVEPRTARPGQAIVVRVTLSAAATPANVAGVGVVLRGPDDTQVTLDLQQQPDGRWQRQVVAPAVPGAWVLVPVILRRDLSVLRAPPVTVQVVPG